MKKNITSLLISFFASVSVVFAFQETFYRTLVLYRFDDLDGFAYSFPVFVLLGLLSVIIYQKRENLFTKIGFWICVSSVALLLASIVFGIVIFGEHAWIVLILSVPACFFLLISALLPFLVSLFTKPDNQKVPSFSASTPSS